MRDRTADLLTASQALSQLSYSPVTINWTILYHVSVGAVKNYWFFKADKPNPGFSSAHAASEAKFLVMNR